MDDVSIEDLDTESFEIFRREAVRTERMTRKDDEAMYISNACVFPSDWTTENLMKMHNSRPYNPDLANTFFRAGYIESWGRGIQKICEECELIGAKAPEYSLLGDDITVKFTAIATGSSSNRTNDVRKENTINARVLELISAQLDISMSEMADLWECPIRLCREQCPN